jgi:hypothetical protein
MYTGQWGDFVGGVSARVNEVIDQSQDLSMSFMSTGLFDYVNNPDDLIYRTQGVTGLSYLEGKDELGNLKKDQTYPAYQTEYVMSEKGKIVEISQMLSKTRSQELESKLNEVKQSMISAQRSLKKHAWYVLANGFSTTDISSSFPIMRLDDAVAMFNASHPSKVPGVAVRSNLASGNPSFTADSPFTLQRIIREQLNGRGLEIGYDGEFVFVVPPALEKLAYETFKSTGRADTGNNDINYYKGMVDFISVNYLGNASNGQTNADTSYFCIAKNVPEGNRSMKYVELIAPKIEMDVDFNSKAIKVSVDAAWAFGYSTWEYMSASQGTNA